MAQKGGFPPAIVSPKLQRLRLGCAGRNKLITPDDTLGLSTWERPPENRLRVRPDRWFFVPFACLAALVVGYGFSHTIGKNLLHTAIARPPILWVHGFVFFGWIALFIVQSTLIMDPSYGLASHAWCCGNADGATMPVIGVATSLRMARFDLDHGMFDAAESAAFLSIPFNDMIFFTGALAAAFWWRRRLEVHRRMIVLATCLLTAAAFARFPFITITALKWYAGVDILLAQAVAWDLWDRGRLHRAYAISLPLVLSGQVAAMWLYLGRRHRGSSLLGICFDPEDS